MQAIVEQDNPYHSRTVRCDHCGGCSYARWKGIYVHEQVSGCNPPGGNCQTPTQVMVYPHKQNAVLINSNFRRVTELNQQLETKLQAVSAQNTQLITSLANVQNRMEEDKKNFASVTTKLHEELQALNANLTQTRTDIVGLTKMLNEVAAKLQQFVRGATRAVVRLVAGDEHPEQELIGLE